MARVIKKIVGSSRADVAFWVCMALMWAVYASLKISYS